MRWRISKEPWVWASAACWFSDIGLLAILAKMKTAGELPADLIIKTSVMMAPASPASARILEDLGATTINISLGLVVAQVAAIRAAIDAPIDFYVEAPDNIGGFHPQLRSA